eukprot:3488692-Amphidinium_carterae.1
MLMRQIFAWDRTVSRLMEMQSKLYLNDVARSMSGEQFLGKLQLGFSPSECAPLCPLVTLRTGFAFDF